MTIRPARAGDAAAIAEIWNAMIRDTSATFTTIQKSAAEVAELITGRSAFLVHERDGIEGFATFGAFRAGPGYAHTAEVTVILRRDCCGKGAGAALLQELESAAVAQNMHALVAAISGENPGALRFFQRMGYGPVLRLPEVGRKFERWMDLVLVVKNL